MHAVVKPVILPCLRELKSVSSGMPNFTVARHMRQSDDHLPYRTVVIVPTYNERENVEKLCRHVTGLAPEIEVLVVDDNSPDGTAELVQRLKEDEPRVHLLRREGKLGLGTAHIAGYRWALEHDYERIVTMDADFSHPPDAIPDMVRASRDCQVVIGSRYIPGGGWEGWPMRRVILSSVSNWVTRAALRMQPKDCTGAFRCFRREVLEQIPLDRIRATGYCFMEEMLWQCSGRGFRIGEVPIVFVDREQGTSKISTDEFLGAVLTIVWLMFTPEGEKMSDHAA